jgi:hypothetical protein
MARHLVEGFAEEYPADIWHLLATAFADLPALSAQVTELHAELVNTRLNRANLAAAALAAISAHHDGEPDPLSYVRDELCAQGYDISRGHR